ncbi:MAG: molecular chaperone HtpG, partial [Candidatus Latescibacteria bacterium]|nr:molecular chaperone HtpG [Candidatus Latescibacterota bacterium]
EMTEGDRIRKNVVKRVFQALGEMKKDDYEAYVGFYSELGLIFKEGISQDHENQEQIADLLLFEAISTEPGKHTTLEAYVENMPADQEEIYFLTGENRSMLEHTPYLEVFRDKEWDVLFMTDPIDEFVIPSLTEYKGKKLKPVDKAEVEADEVTKVKAEEHEKTYKTFIEMLKEKITEVQDVRLTTRLKESASCLVSDEGMPGANMERIMQRMGQTDGAPTGQRILELNPEHPAVEGLQKLFDSTPEDERIESFSRLLYEEAVIAEGSKLNDPVGFARRVNELLVKGLA